MSESHWPRYYEVTVDRPAWQTVRTAIELFARDDEASGGAPHVRGLAGFAVDLGCGAGRDTRELLRNGWRVLAIDREPSAIATLRAATSPGDLARLETLVADLATVAIPECDLLNASISLPFLAPGPHASAWRRALEAVRPGGRLAAMLFGDRDDAASDPTMTCRAPDAIRADLAAWEIEHWNVQDEPEGRTALGDPWHFHLIEVVARRPW